MKMAIARVKEIYEAIDKLGYGSHISIDLGMIQHLDYYTGVIFKGYIHEIGEEIVSGGRYDELIGNFGEMLPAVDSRCKLITRRRCRSSKNRMNERE